ncbi:MAG: hypothetical protein K9N49_01895 [Candidatus Marinimicrobia bacterium]|nr:hypothetical protein [Candidatus Neomarinimicrobiota bacterium]
MQTLDRLLGKQSHLRLLRTLYGAETPLSGRDLQRRTGLSNRATMQALGALCAIGAVERWQEGTRYRHRLNTGHYWVAKVLAPAFEAERQFWQDLARTIRKHLRPRPMAAVLTGSLARQGEPVNARLDLVLLFQNGRTRLAACRGLPVLTAALACRYALPSSVTLVDLNSMDRQEYDALWRRVEREGLLLFGNLA